MKANTLKPPCAPLYLLAGLLFPVIFGIKFGFRREKNRPYPKEGPFVLLMNHASNYDFAFAYSNVWPRKMHAVVSSHFFTTKWLSRLLRVMGCISIRQFTPDPGAIKSMISAVRAGRGLLIFPEAEVNGRGCGGTLQGGVAKLLKMLAAPVYLTRDFGAYLSAPKWAKTARRGRILTETSLLFSKEELKEKSLSEVESALQSAFTYDEAEWEKQANIPFRGRRLAEGLETVLHRCPRCGALYTGASRGNEFTCTACGNRAVMNEYGFLAPKGEEDRVYESVSAWTRWQMEVLRKEFQSSGFSLSAPAEIRVNDGKSMKKHIPAGEGEIALSEKGFSYEGTLRGERVSLCFPLEGLFRFPFSPKRGDFEVPNTKEVLAFAPREARMVSAFVQGLIVLKEKADC